MRSKIMKPVIFKHIVLYSEQKKIPDLALFAYTSI